jgi:hypothetical protein
MMVKNLTVHFTHDEMLADDVRIELKVKHENQN